MSEEVYRTLAAHLDRLPGGFAPSDTGADLRLLQTLFTPEEAELATHLTLDRDDDAVIAERARLPFAEAQARLDTLAGKGLIFSVQPAGGPRLYHAVPWVLGIYEFQVNNLSDDLLTAIADWGKTRAQRPRVQTIPQMRTIPVGQSIEPHLEALPYEQVDAIVKAHDRFAVAPCICRRTARLAGRGCSAPEESCLMFGEHADYFVRNGLGRAIDRSEVMEILARADAANLVLQPSNSRDSDFICCCCGCCCGVLRGLQAHPRPAESVASSFIAQFDPQACQGCRTCLERCQMAALSADGDRVVLDAGRCIGCGLCVTTCPSGALTLVRKPGADPACTPATLDAMWRTIVRDQASMR